MDDPVRTNIAESYTCNRTNCISMNIWMNFTMLFSSVSWYALGEFDRVMIRILATLRNRSTVFNIIQCIILPVSDTDVFVFCSLRKLTELDYRDFLLDRFSTTCC